MIAHLVLCVLYLTACGAKDCCPKVCDLSDSECITAGTSLVYKLVVAGDQSSLQSLDPLTIKEVSGNNDTTNYTLTNVELKGLAKCDITKLQLHVTTGEFELSLHCPELIATFNYGTSGKPICQDKIMVTANDYNVLYMGLYGVIISPEDLNPHFFVKNTIPKVSVTVKEINVKQLGDAKSNSANITNQTAENIMSAIVNSAVKLLFQGIAVVLKKNQMGAVLPAVAPTKPCNKEN